MSRRFSLIFLALCSLSLQAVEVTDDSGKQLTLNAPAQRIISLAPHVTEQLYAIGAGERIVGAVDYSDYPEAAKRVPRVGGYSRLDLEQILALKPDLVIGWQGGNNSQQLERLEALGLRLYRSEPRRLDDIASGMERLGLLTGNEHDANDQATQFRQRVEQLRHAAQGRAPRTLFYQIWDRPLMTVNGEHLINEVITLCGGRNIFAALPLPTPKVSTEAVIAADPEVIIASGMGAERPEWLDEWRQWPQLRAVKGERLYVIDPNLIQRATPRLLDGVAQMCGFINP
ncbi:MAG: cobalamin-binding protein [Gammaproteobacteria bacterium]|nr:cobalamin-binding protein [Gammaproteobacteria bacterium]